MHYFVTEMCTCAHFCYKMVHCGIRYYLDHTLNSKKIYHNSKCQNLPSQVSYGYLSWVFKTLIMYQQDGTAVIEQQQKSLHIHFVWLFLQLQHVFVVPCFVMVLLLALVDSCDVFTHGVQGCFTSTGSIVWLPQFTRNNMDKTDQV